MKAALFTKDKAILVKKALGTNGFFVLWVVYVLYVLLGICQ